MQLTMLDGTTQTLTQCERFSLIRERYLPYATMRVICITQSSYRNQKPVRMCAMLDDHLLIDGQVQQFAWSMEAGLGRLQIVAQGDAIALLHNQLVPGIYNDATLASLMTTYPLPHITYETGVEELKYIYVKPNSAIWDTLIAYNYKLNHGFPYVVGANHLRVTAKPDTVAVSVPDDRILKYRFGSEAKRLVSRYDMADVDGNYGTYTQTNPTATERSLVRVKQIALDKQYLYDPIEALNYRIAFTNRQYRSTSVTYLGYRGEDIEDMVQLGSIATGHVSRIVVSGSSKGIFTEDTLYYDNFCN